MRFIHTADIHLGKTYRNSPGENERYEDFFRCLSGIVADAVREQVDFVLIGGDLFHIGQILPKPSPAPLKPCSRSKTPPSPASPSKEITTGFTAATVSRGWKRFPEMNYIRLLRPSRTEDGGYRFEPFDEKRGWAGT